MQGSERKEDVQGYEFREACPDILLMLLVKTGIQFLFLNSCTLNGKVSPLHRCSAVT